MRSIVVYDDDARVLRHALGRINDHVAGEVDLVVLQEITQVGFRVGTKQGDELAATVQIRLQGILFLSQQRVRCAGDDHFRGVVGHCA